MSHVEPLLTEKTDLVRHAFDTSRASNKRNNLALNFFDLHSTRRMRRTRVVRIVFFSKESSYWPRDLAKIRENGGRDSGYGAYKFSNTEPNL